MKVPIPRAMSSPADRGAPGNLPKVSVVIPSRNRRQMLRVAVRSVLRQVDVDLELIVIDDGSTDGTGQMLAAIKDPRLHVIRRDEAGGVSSARNMGIHAARGDWIAFLDDDDLWAPSKLALQLERARSTGAGWVYTGEVIVGPSLEILGRPSRAPSPESVMDDILIRNLIPGGASSVIAFRRDVEDLGGFDPALSALADWDLWIRLARRGAPACVPQPLVGYRIHPANMSLDWRTFEAEDEIIAARHGLDVDRIRQYRHAAWSMLRMGRRGEAFRLYVRAVAAGDWRSVARALVALVPGITTELLFRFRRGRLHDGDPRSARAWVDELACEDAA